MNQICNMKMVAMFISFALIIFMLTACSNSAEQEFEYDNKATASSKEIITIGSKSFTEQYLLMKMTGILLREQGYKVEEITTKGSSPLRAAFEEGFVDQYWEYTNTARTFYHQKPAIHDPDRAFAEVAKEDLQKGLVWLPRSEFDSTWILVIKREFAELEGLQTISDLANYIRSTDKQLKFATNDEFLFREDGMERLKETYNFDVADQNVFAVDAKLLSQAVKESRVEVSVSFASDARVQAYDLVILEDDLNFFPPYHVAPVVNQNVLSKYPNISPILKELTTHIKSDTMRKLTYQVDVLYKDVTEVAMNFLKEANLLKNQ